VQPPLGECSSERGADECDSRGQVAEHERRRNADHAEAEPRELAIPPRVSAWLTRVNRAIHFNDEPDARRQEISDELPANGHLAPKRNAELTSLERRPKASFRLREAAAMLPSEELEPSG